MKSGFKVPLSSTPKKGNNQVNLYKKTEDALFLWKQTNKQKNAIYIFFVALRQIKYK